jgi:hypothetical protein
MTMTKKNDRPLPNERIDGVGDRIGQVSGAASKDKYDGLGTRSPIKRAKRKPKTPNVMRTPVSPEMQVRMDLATTGRASVPWLSDPLRNRDGHPTLADRVRAEGIAAYGKSFAARSKASKTKKITKKGRK